MIWFVERENWLSKNHRKKIKRMEREVAVEPAAEEVGLLFGDVKVEGGAGDEEMDESL